VERKIQVVGQGQAKRLRVQSEGGSEAAGRVDDRSGTGMKGEERTSRVRNGGGEGRKDMGTH